MARIISNYTLKEDNTGGDQKPRRNLDHIIKIPVIQGGEVLIPNGEPEPEPEPKIEPEIEIVVEDEAIIEEIIPVVEDIIVPEEPKEPVLQLIRNGDGIVIGIEVQCGCGEKIIIKMEY